MNQIRRMMMNVILTRSWIGLLIGISVLMFACEKNRIKNKCCQDEYEIITTKFVQPDSFSLYIPQAFTPNNDGRNEYFTPIGRGFSIESMIIKRGLKTVFDYKDHVEPFWDGGSEKNGSYKYEFTLRLSNGELIDVEGSVCIIRYGSVEEKNHDLKREKICECVLSDMLHPRDGVIKDTPECPQGYSPNNSDD
ncbi:MAG: hypothetical protein WEC59_00015 [Salibacteraceae bacterium]